MIDLINLGEIGDCNVGGDDMLNDLDQERRVRRNPRDRDHRHRLKRLKGMRGEP